MRPLRRLAPTLAIALLLSACADDGPTLVAGDPSSPPPTASPTAATATPGDGATDEQLTTTGATPTPSAPDPTPTAPDTPPPAAERTPSPEATPSPPLPPTAQPCTIGLAGDPVTTETAAADVDGDGAADQITVYRIRPAGADDRWRIRVDTAAGESLDSELLVDAGTDAVTPIGGADVDGDATTDEVFTVVGTGASAVIVAIHNRIGCELVQTTIGSAPVAFPIGGGVASIGGLQCLDTDDNGVTNSIVAWSGVADFDAGDGVYRIDGVEYQLRGTELVQVGTTTLVADVAEADFVYGQLSCGALNL